MLKGERIAKYLATKGLTEEDLFNNQAVFLDSDGAFKCADITKQWIHNEVIHPEADIEKVTIMDILYKKQKQYVMEGVTEAIFIPLFNLCSNFVGFSIRKMGENKHDSWFMPGERKVDLIYNLNNAVSEAAKKNSLILTEGVYDTIALKKHGFLNSGALLGTNMSHIQLFQVTSIVDNIALCLDNDNAGISAIKKISENSVEGVRYYYATIDKDPDEFLKDNGPEEFKRRIKRV